MKEKVKILAFLVVLVLLINMFVPTLKIIAFAATNSVTVSFRNGYNAEQGKVQYSINDGASWVDVTENLENQVIEMSGDNFKIRIIPNEGFRVDFSGITYREDNNAELGLNDNANSSIARGLTSGNGYQVDSNVETIELKNVEFRADEHHEEGEPGDEHNGPRYGWDDDSVYFVWATEGESNNFYYHKITGIVGQGPMNYIPVSEIVDENTSVRYNINNRTRTGKHSDGNTEEVNSYEFVWTDGLMDAISDEDFMNLPTTQKFDYLFENGMTVNPISAINGANCISTMGDLAFKLTIYNDEVNSYEGIKIGVPDDYEYFPSFWDPVFHWDIVDVSKTTKDNPAIYEAFLLEKTLQLNSANFSREIAAIKPLNVPAKAVTVKNIGNGKWNITYSSNYYDDVELEITDVNGQKYYIILLRINVEIRDIWTEEANPKTQYAAIYYPSTDSYKNYSILLTINYKDGSSETKLLTMPHKGLDGGNGDIIEEYEISGGENLKTAWYELTGIKGGPSSTFSSFYITVLKDYSVTSENFGGTLSGADNGIEFKDNGHGIERVIGKN